MISVTRPWGSYKVLSECERYVVKELTIDPGKSLSDQRHFGRSEVWTLIKGEINMDLQPPHNSYTRSVIPCIGDAVTIEKGCWHLVTNTGDVPAIVVEVWSGGYLDEGDIERRD